MFLAINEAIQHESSYKSQTTCNLLVQIKWSWFHWKILIVDQVMARKWRACPCLGVHAISNSCFRNFQGWHNFEITSDPKGTSSGSYFWLEFEVPDPCMGICGATPFLRPQQEPITENNGNWVYHKIFSPIGQKKKFWPITAAKYKYSSSTVKDDAYLGFRPACGLTSARLSPSIIYKKDKMNII